MLWAKYRHWKYNVNVKEIQDRIHAMPIGKAVGYDSVSNEHFKYANEKLHVLMSLLYSSMLIQFFFTRCCDNYNHSPHN